VTLGEHLATELFGGGSVAGDDSVDALDDRHQFSESRLPDAARLIQHLGAVHLKQVEEVGRQHDAPRVGGRRAAGRGLLEGARPAGRIDGECFAVQYAAVAGEGGHCRGDFGQPDGDLVQASGVDTHPVALLVRLDAYPVQLRLDRYRIAAQLGERLGDRRRAGSQHRQYRTTHLQPNRRQSLGTASGRRLCRGRHGAAEHRGPPHQCQRDVEGSGDRLQQDAFERSLASLTDNHPAQEALLVVGGPVHQLGQARFPGELRARSAEVAQPIEGGVDLGEREARRHCRPETGQRTPPDSGATLPQPPGEEVREQVDLIGLGLGEQVGQHRDLAVARTGRRHLSRGVNHGCEEHAPFYLVSGTGSRSRLVRDGAVAVCRDGGTNSPRTVTANQSVSQCRSPFEKASTWLGTPQ